MCMISLNWTQNDGVKEGINWVYLQNGVLFGSDGNAADCVHHGEESIDRHKNQGVDTRMTRDENHVLNLEVSRISIWHVW